MNSLMPHQSNAVELFLKRKRLLCHWDVGTGKTAVALKSAENINGKTIYVCPSILKNQIVKETEKFTNLKAVSVVGTKEERTTLMENKNYNIYVINYEMIKNHFKDILYINPSFIVLDECQKIANPSNVTTKWLKKLSVEYRLAMSATPFPNALHELWSIGDWLYPRAFGDNFYQWRAVNCKMNPYFPAIIGYYNEEKIRKSFAQFTNRIRREEVLNLPPLEEKRLEISLDKEHNKVYKTLKETLILELNNKEKLLMPNLLTLLVRLRQIVDCPRVLGLDLVSEKEKALDELLEIISEKLIVFFEHTQVLHKINEKHKALVVDGSVAHDKRIKVLEEFKTGKNKILFMSAAGAEGLNLEFARYVVHYQLPWTDARIDQRTGRVYRHGQTSECFSYRIVAKDTVDEKLEKIIAKKRKLNREDLIKLIK